MTFDTNNVWGSLGDAGGKFLDFLKAREDRKAATTAAPSGNVNSVPFNPMPRQFSAFPQADGKFDPSAMNMSSLSWLFIGGGILLLLIAVLRR